MDFNITENTPIRNRELVLCVDGGHRPALSAAETKRQIQGIQLLNRAINRLSDPLYFFHGKSEVIQILYKLYSSACDEMDTKDYCIMMYSAASTKKIFDSLGNSYKDYFGK